jgi:hypothetical protein
MKHFKNHLISFSLLVVLFTSCNKNEIPPVPVIPPESSFSMDFNNFQNEKSTNFLLENWLYSVLSVSFFNTISATHMVVPTAAFKASFTQTPAYIGEQTWQWSYQFPVIGATYTARLNGITEKKNSVRWEMYIDKAGSNGFTNFLWFQGTSTDSTQANWTIYENPTSPSTVLEIDWETNADQTQSNLKYTYVSSSDEDADSFIEFGKDPNLGLNRFYTIYMAKSNIDINIEWDSTERNGRVKSPNHYKDEIWHCWNKNLIDDFCEE